MQTLTGLHYILADLKTKCGKDKDDQTEVAAADSLEDVLALLEEEIVSVEWNADTHGTQLKAEIAAFEASHELGTRKKVLALAERVEGLSLVCNDLKMSIKKEADEDGKEDVTGEEEETSNGDGASEFSVILSE